jgi:WD40 repeat protein
MGASIYGFQRNREGTLTQLPITPQTPLPKKGDFYCTSLAAADRKNHVAIAVRQFNAQSWQPDGPPQLATYTSDASGNLTTKSTFLNMPKQAVNYPVDIKMSPSGKLLAVAGAAGAGTAGIQVFHFNGSNPITHYTGLLTKDPVDQLSWDNHNHLYAVSRSAGKVFVFTITPTKFSQAPGSPYTITNPQNITVLPKT